MVRVEVQSEPFPVAGVVKSASYVADVGHIAADVDHGDGVATTIFVPVGEVVSALLVDREITRDRDGFRVAGAA